MIEEALRAVLRDPTYPRELRLSAYRMVVQHATPGQWEQAMLRIEDLTDREVFAKPRIVVTA